MILVAITKQTNEQQNKDDSSLHWVFMAKLKIVFN